jgi:hypothetical protein
MPRTSSRSCVQGSTIANTVAKKIGTGLSGGCVRAIRLDHVHDLPRLAYLPKPPDRNVLENKVKRVLSWT